MSRTSGVGFLLLAFVCLLSLASPAAASAPKADIVFVLDESGSMADEIDDVREQIRGVAAAVSAQVDARYALVGFGGGTPGVRPNEPFTRTDFTTAAGLARALAGSGAYAGGGGGVEMGLYATTYSLTALAGFRPEAGTCAVLVSDEPPSFKVDLASDLADASAALARRNAAWFGVVLTSDPLVRRTYGPDEGSLAYVSGGAVFRLTAFRNDASEVLQRVIARCARAVEETSSCTVRGTSGPDVLWGTPGDDVICGLAGDDTVVAGGGNDTVYGGIGSDSVRGGAGNDRLLGGFGNDRLVGGVGRDVVSGDRGRDRLLGRAGGDTIRGGRGADVLVGHGGRDAILGNDGDDRVAARDRMSDLVRGGGGADVGVVDLGLDTVRSVERLR